MFSKAHRCRNINVGRHLLKDNNMEKETLLKLIPPTISMIVTAIFGLGVGILIEKFKNRFRTITYTIRTQKVAPTLSANLGGQLKITLNNLEINTLKVTTIEIENGNNVDFENIVVKFGIGKGGIFQGNEGYLVNNSSWIYRTEEYASQYDKAVKELNELPIDPQTGLRDTSNEFQSRIDYLNTNRNYFIPVFNRGESAVFNFLIEDPVDGTIVEVFPSLIYKSVNFVKKPDNNSQAQTDLWIGVGIGLAVVSLIDWALVTVYPVEKAIIIWSTIVGVSYSIVGYGILYIFRKTMQFFK